MGMSRKWWCWLPAVGLLLIGCSSAPRPIVMPSLNPDTAANEALAEYDANRDGFLDSDELARCPALAKNIRIWDTDRDGRLSHAEIKGRLSSYVKSKTAILNQELAVWLDETPLVGASVTLVPEKFMGAGIKPASGVTDGAGRTQLQVAGQPVPGAHLGLYRVQVSRKRAEEQEELSPYYNTQTVLGLEVAPDLRGDQGFHLSGQNR